MCIYRIQKYIPSYVFNMDDVHYHYSVYILYYLFYIQSTYNSFCQRYKRCVGKFAYESRPYQS